MTTTFAANPGVQSFETGGPDGSLIRVEADKPFSTDDPAVATILANAGHAVSPVTSSARTEKAAPKAEAVGGGES